jgi:ribosome maturation factor RimP
MIKANAIRELLEAKMEQTGLFLVDVKVIAGNKIVVYADSNKGITVEECCQINKYIETNLDREVEDFELEVSSPGIAQPFKVIEQYRKNKGKEVQVLLKDGMKRIGTLTEVDNSAIQLNEKIKIKGKTESTIENVPFSEI